MSDRKLRWLGLGLVASARAALLALTSAMNPAFAQGITPEASVGDSSGGGYPTPPGNFPFGPGSPVDYAEIMGGSGNPIPSEGLNSQYMGAVFDRYLAPNFPDLTFPCDPTGSFSR